MMNTKVERTINSECVNCGAPCPSDFSYCDACALIANDDGHCFEGLELVI